MAIEKSDAIVVFGVTGDLAYKKIFPALHALVRRGHLKEPVIGVAKTERTPEQIRAKVRESLENHGGVDPQALASLLGLLRYVSGDYRDSATFERLRKALGFAYADPVEDANKANHVGMVRYGTEPLMVWGAAQGMANPKHLLTIFLWEFDRPLPGKARSVPVA